MTIISTKYLTNGRGLPVTQTLVSHNGKYYIVSDNTRETIIFISDKDGNNSYEEVGSGTDTKDCFKQIENGQIMSFTK